MCRFHCILLSRAEGCTLTVVTQRRRSRRCAESPLVSPCATGLAQSFVYTRSLIPIAHLKPLGVFAMVHGTASLSSVDHLSRGACHLPRC